MSADRIVNLVTGKPDEDAATWSPEDSTGELLPLLLSASSETARKLLSDIPHRTVVPGRLFVGLGAVSTTAAPPPSGGRHRAAPNASFAGLLAEATARLAKGLRTDGHRTGDGTVLNLRRDGGLATSALVLPDFHSRLAVRLGADELLVGLPNPDEVLVTAANSGMADYVREAALSSSNVTTELVPSVLLVAANRIELLAERDVNLN